jgi:hypothetical protein
MCLTYYLFIEIKLIVQNTDATKKPIIPENTLVFVLIKELRNIEPKSACPIPLLISRSPESHTLSLKINLIQLYHADT